MFKKMKLGTIGAMFAGAIALCSGAQTAVDERPLPETMEFLQTILNHSSLAAWTTSYHDNADRTDWSYRFSFEVKQVVADPKTCTLTYHTTARRDRVVIGDRDATIDLHAITGLELLTGEERQQQENFAAGHKTWHATVAPEVYDLLLHGTGMVDSYFLFSDEITAQRVAQSMGHAVTLCGGKTQS